MRVRTAAACLCLALILGADLPARQAASGSFRGLVVKMAPSRTEQAEDLRADAEETAAKAGRTPWRVRDVRPAEGVFVIGAPATESSAQITPAQAWQKAHELRQNPKFEYVEPSFAVNGAPGETTELEDCVAAPRPESGGSTPAIAGAAQHPEWSLDREHGANVIKAWELFGDVTPGDGVWVGHPDTGYRRHPEIWDASPRPVHPELGWDFVDNDDDPADLFHTGTLRWPGHGTKTSSVIVSPRGRQMTGSGANGVSGVAPGASLIPLRVANGVVLFEQTNLASAIRAAAGDDRTLVKRRVDVISISLGGPPSRVLEEAVQLAERKGVIVVAAAGNNVKKVVWPARYPHVVAVAASNYDSKVWSGSSGGSMVAIGAPGESVWIASPKREGEVARDCIATSSGTSYGTATTAGIAALWVSKHRGTPGFKALAAAGQLTSVFRAILQSTRRAVPGWDVRKYGPGIVDAAAVLAAPLPAPRESALEPRGACDAELAALESLFEDAPDPRTRIATLFGRPAADLCALRGVADEAAFHYATDAPAAAAIDRITGTNEPAATAYASARRALRRVGSAALRQSLPR